MLGLMMNRQLTITSLLQYAAQYHPRTEIVSRTVEGPIHRYGYADAYARTRQLANALVKLGVEPGDRIATLAWNGYRHYELYFGISGMGAVLHTINPRLFPEQIAFITNHAQDQVLFFDLTFLPLIEGLAAHMKTVKHFVAMTDRAHMPKTDKVELLCYEDLMAAEKPDYVWPELDENTASSMCYTSGTTGNPKAALYSHRSTVLHSFSACMADTLGISSADSVLPVVPMFHVNAWGTPYSSTMCGSKIVYPGPKMDGASLVELFEQEKVTLTLGVPTVWLALLKYLDDSGTKLSTVNRTVIGGSACPLAMIKAFEEKHGIQVVHAWGMTEMSPLGTVGTMKRDVRDRPLAEQYPYKVKQGRAVYGVDLKIVDDAGQELPQDGKASGELYVRGPWIIREYYNDAAGTKAAFDPEGWFGTGDVCSIDTEGFLQITDRKKDMIKSGGEWISSIDLENAAVGHPEVAEAAVIGVAHPKWDERPLLVVVPKPGTSPTREGMLAYLEDKVAKWWLPDDVVFVKELPHTATGKLLKTRLRDDFKAYKLPTA